MFGLDPLNIINLFTSITSVIGEFVKARSEDSDGGTTVTTSEIISLSAEVAAAWADTGRQKKEFTAEELVDAYRRAGFMILDDEV